MILTFFKLQHNQLLNMYVFKSRLTAKRSSTWVKMRVSGKGQQTNLVLCYTFEIPQNVTLGHSDGMVFRIFRDILLLHFKYFFMNR